MFLATFVQVDSCLRCGGTSDIGLLSIRTLKKYAEKYGKTTFSLHVSGSVYMQGLLSILFR